MVRDWQDCEPFRQDEETSATYICRRSRADERLAEEDGVIGRHGEPDRDCQSFVAGLIKNVSYPTIHFCFRFANDWFSRCFAMPARLASKGISRGANLVELTGENGSVKDGKVVCHISHTRNADLHGCRKVHVNDDFDSDGRKKLPESAKPSSRLRNHVQKCPSSHRMCLRDHHILSISLRKTQSRGSHESGSENRSPLALVAVLTYR
jgi:hypothetical protein